MAEHVEVFLMAELMSIITIIMYPYMSWERMCIDSHHWVCCDSASGASQPPFLKATLCHVQYSKLHMAINDDAKVG